MDVIESQNDPKPSKIIFLRWITVPVRGIDDHEANLRGKSIGVLSTNEREAGSARNCAHETEDASRAMSGLLKHWITAKEKILWS